MNTHIPDRAEALALLKEFTRTESLLRHAYAVEAVMRHLARQHGEDEQRWGVIGLIHDLDYEQFPDRHCQVTERILRERGWPADYIRAVLSHAWGVCTDVRPESTLEKSLYAIDELTGLVAATVWVRPSRSLQDLTPKSVRKKWNQKSFAAGVDRDVIERGAEMLGVEIEALIADVIAGMRQAAGALGMDGSRPDGGATGDSQSAEQSPA